MRSDGIARPLTAPGTAEARRSAGLGDKPGSAVGAQICRTLTAFGPFGPGSDSYSTLEPSASER